MESGKTFMAWMLHV